MARGARTIVVEQIEDERPRWFVRIRALVLLVLFTVVLGTLAAAILGMGAVALTTLIDHALE